MPDIPKPAISAGAEAVNEAHAKRGWNKPAPWWTEEVATAILEAAAPLLAEAWGAFECEPLRAEGRAEAIVTEWGMRHDDCLTDVHDYGRDKEAARQSVADHARLNGRLVRRTVTYSPWEPSPVPPEGEEP